MAVVHLINSDEHTRCATGSLLAAAGYKVHTYAVAGDYLVMEPDNEVGCLLLSLHLPGVNGLKFQAALRRYPAYERPIIFLTANADVASTVQAMQAGARDFLTEPVDGETLLAAVRAAVEHDQRRRANQALCDFVRSSIAALSERERKVLDGIAQGRLNKQLAVELGVSERTVKADRSQVMHRLGVRSLAEMVKLLIEARCDRGGFS